MKTLALDIGDRWTGVAISDPLGILARPYTTIKTNELTSFLDTIITTEHISTIVVGCPTTLRGTESDQTKKTIAITKELEQKYTMVQWTLWDERLTSKMASKMKARKTPEEKLQIHARAAALILSGYLEFQRMQRDDE